MKLNSIVYHIKTPDVSGVIQFLIVKIIQNVLWLLASKNFLHVAFEILKIENVLFEFYTPVKCLWHKNWPQNFKCQKLPWTKRVHFHFHLTWRIQAVSIWMQTLIFVDLQTFRKFRSDLTLSRKSKNWGYFKHKFVLSLTPKLTGCHSQVLENSLII